MVKKIVSKTGNALNDVSKRLESGVKLLDSRLSKLVSNPYVAVSLKVFICLYAAFAAPSLPKNVALLLDSTIVRVIFAALIVYSAIKDPVLSILLAIAFIVTLQKAGEYKLWNSSLSVTSGDGISWLPSAQQGAVEDAAPEDAEEAPEEENVDLVESVRQIGEGASEGVRSVGAGVTNSVRSIGSGVVGGATSAGEGLLDGVSTLGSCVIDSAQQIGSGLLTGVNEVGSGLLGGVRDIGSGVSDGINNVGSGLGGGVRSAVPRFVIEGMENKGDGEQEEQEVPQPIENVPCAFSAFTQDYDLVNASSNQVPGADQGSCVQTLESQFCPQGLQNDGVQGY